MGCSDVSGLVGGAIGPRSNKGINNDDDRRIPFMKKSTFRNVMSAAMNPEKFAVMIKKLLRRYSESRISVSNDGNIRWIKDNCSEFGVRAAQLDSELWEEANLFGAQLKAHAEKVLSKIDSELGGGGFYPMIYFLVRYLKPVTVVETGVAAGFSSSAVLTALKKNGRGTLWSSDFPYFRISHPEQFIGVVVAEDLKKNWRLFTKGDDRNLPRIIEEVEMIDFVHYDSDKTYFGRKRALDILHPKLSDTAVIILDDIQDNSHFQDLVNEGGHKHWGIYEFEGKYIGLLGILNSGSV